MRQDTKTSALPVGSQKASREACFPSPSVTASEIPDEKLASFAGTRRSLGGSGSIRQAAFTLIELILVMSILIAVIAFAAPSLSHFFRGRTLQSEARRLLSLTRHGQSRAVFEGVPMILWVDSKERIYGVEEQPGYTDRDTRAVEFKLADDLSFEVSYSNKFNLNRVESLATVKANELLLRSVHGKLPYIYFLPDGTFGENSFDMLRIYDKNSALWLLQSSNRVNYEIQNQPYQANENRR